MRLWIAFLLASLLGAAADAAAATDTRPLSADERTAFEALLCQQPKNQGKDLVCGRMLGYPGTPPGATLSLYTVALGAFSKAGADEAYLSYGSSVEPHANNFGGGVLLARAGDGWRLVHWYPGAQMDNCVALPGDGKTKMLCLSGWTGQGELDSSVWVKEVPFAHDRAVLKAQDQRGIDHGIAPDMCADAPAPVLLSIDALKRAQDPATVAVASITYATAKDVRDGCKHGFAHVKETKGEVRIVLDNGRVKAITPLRFAEPDY